MWYFSLQESTVYIGLCKLTEMSHAMYELHYSLTMAKIHFSSNLFTDS
jgi:hypothetical protein